MNVQSVANPAPWAGRLGWGVTLALASLVSLASMRYFAGGEIMAPPPLKANFHDHPFAFYVHIAAASTALLVGPWQFLARLRQTMPQVHRAMGKVYVTACALGGSAAIVIAPGSNGGWVAAAGFLCLAALWLWTTGMAVFAIRAGRVEAHRRWMRRSFALTLAGVTLRLYLPLAFSGFVTFASAYAAIAWLCWVPNLLLVDRLGRGQTNNGRSLKFSG